MKVIKIILGLFNYTVMHHVFFWYNRLVARFLTAGVHYNKIITGIGLPELFR